MSILKNLSSVFQSIAQDHIEEVMQKCAWRLVRAASDRFQLDSGIEKRSWAIKEFCKEFEDLDEEIAEHHIRAAYVNFKITTAI